MLRPDAFRSEISCTGSAWIIALFGELDLATAPEVERALRIARAAGGGVTLDLTGLQFMDATGVNLIMRLDAVARRDGTDLCVIAGSEIVWRVVQVAGIDAYVNVVNAPGPAERSARAEYAVIATDLEGLVTLWNDQAERLYGWSALEVLGRSIGELLVGPEDRQVAEQILRQVQRTGHWEGEFEVRTRTGGRFAAHVRDALIRDDEGNVTGFVGLSVKTSQLALTPT